MHLQLGKNTVNHFVIKNTSVANVFHINLLFSSLVILTLTKYVPQFKKTTYNSTCLWVSTGNSQNYFDLVILLFILNLAVARPHLVQSGSLDLHTGCCSNEALLLFGNRISIGHSNLFECKKSFNCTTDGAYVEVLLLGGKSEIKKWYFS